MSEEVELGTEEKQFTMNILSGMDMEAAARASGIVPPGTSSAVAKRIASQALDDDRIRAEIVDAFEAVDLRPEHVTGALKGALSAMNYGLWQKDGTKVELGEDGMTRVSAAKLITQIMGWTGGPRAKPVDQNPPPATVQVNFNVRNVREPGRKADAVIDGDSDYSVS